MMHADVSAAYLEPCLPVPLSTSALDAVALPIGTTLFFMLERSRILKTQSSSSGLWQQLLEAMACEGDDARPLGVKSGFGDR